MNIIETEGLSKKHGEIYRVKDVDLRVPVGGIYGFLGPNGAGKSTTLKMLLGLVKKSEGRMKIFGNEVNSRNRLKILKNVGSLIESPSYYGHLTGEENLKIIQSLKGIPSNNVKEVLEIVRLDDQKNKKVNQYSLGMKQRLGLACALLGYPKLLILDEPTNGLDPAGIQEMRELICSLPALFGMTIVVSSHLLSEIDQIATDVGIINEGELVFQGTLDTLHQKSQQNIAIRTLNNESAGKILWESGVEYKNEEDYLMIPRMEDDRMAECIRKLTERHIGIVRVEERQKSLENIFLELTKKAVTL